MTAPTATTKEPLALHGGTPSFTAKAPARKRWGETELKQLSEMVDQTSLFYWNGPQTKLLKERFQNHYPLQWVAPCSSGTAALHMAVEAAGVGPGDEVIATPITDMGTHIGVLYQQGVPVFADLELDTYNLDVEDVRRKITAKTKAVIAVHLAGNPCDLGALRTLCDERGLVLIEDCAQAWGAMFRGRPIGTVGHIGCWSLNDFKHIACGDGGLVASNDERFGPHLQKMGDKAYNREPATRAPEIVAPNYRLSEPQSAVAAAQMERMWEITGRFSEIGLRLNELLAGVSGLHLPRVHPEDRWVCWFYMFRVDPTGLNCTSREFAAAAQAEGLPVYAGYIQQPIYKYPAFQNHAFFAGRWPIREFGLTDMDYRKVHCPGAETILDTCLQISVNEALDDAWVEAAARTIRKVADWFAK